MDGKLLVILNPVAGKGRARAERPVIEDTFRTFGLPFELRETEATGHATVLAANAFDRGFSLVVAAGGDGTCNEVINGLMESARERGTAPVLGVIPVGRGNDFGYGAGIPSDPSSALQILRSGRAQSLDLGRIVGGDYPQGRYFGNGVGIGFDTIVGLEASRNRFFHGALSYVYGALRTLVIYPEAPDLRVSYNGTERSLRSPQISIMNGRRMGGTFFMAPDAEVSDGLLDLCMAVRPLRRGEMVRLMVRYMKGTQAQSDVIETDRVPRFHVDAPRGGLVCHVDGETICTDGKSLEVECVESALRMIRCSEPRLYHDSSRR